mgnify:CR=1 FL=1
MNNWYIVQFKRNSDKLAKRNLNQQGFKTFLPLQEFTRKSGSKFLTNIKPLFPGYMFVSVDLDRAPWQKINNTLGVSRLICQNGIPARVSDEIVSALISRCDISGKLLPPASLVRGDSVKFVAGALANFVATVETLDSEQRIWVLMDLMGQITRVQIGSDQIKLRN